ncbi:hypothetical protein [Bacillus wiedmannii]|uniref:hypothetical protein n=1 Tax=Bacillus wiedmannii TaxID=1890302 RepID=UPI0015D4BD7F|nr:hypothetical protein [Bacillus wiedmannii]
MAKLNVKVINETVEYNGFVYESVTDGAKTNDLIQCFENDSVDLTYGAFYQVIGTDDYNDMQFLDDDNDERDRSVTDEEYKVFRKSHEITTDKLTDAEGVVKIELPDGTKLEGTPSDLEKITRSMQKMQAEQATAVKMPEEVVEVEDEIESTMSRLKAGEYAKVTTNVSNGQSKLGDIVKITEDDGSNAPFNSEHLDGTYAGWHYETDLVRVTEVEVKAATEPKEEPLKVGDYAKVVGSSHSNYFGGKDGAIVKIVKELDDIFETQELNGGIYGHKQHALKSALVKATDEEVLEAKQALLKEGDFARVIGNTSSHRFEIGTVVKLGTERKTDSENYFRADYLNESDSWLVRRHDLEPLTKEETEHIAREAEEEKKAKAEHEKWAAIGREVGELRDGDVVQFTESTGTSDFSKGSVAIITNVNGDDFNFGKEGLYDGDSAWVKLIVPVEQRFDTVG